MAQPLAKQWENLAACLDRCLVLADRPQGSIFVAWYAHTTTGRVSGVWVRPTKANADKEENWEKAVEWAAADFGFRACLIFRVDVLGANEEGVDLGRSDATPRTPTQARSWRLANGPRSCIRTAPTPEPSCRPLPRFRGFGGSTSAMRSS